MTAAWVGSITGISSACLERRAAVGHAGAAEHQRVGAVAVAQLRADLLHALQRAGAVGELGDAEAERQVAGEALAQAELADVAQMAGQRGPQDGEDAEALAARQRGEQAAFGDAEDRPVGRLAAQLQARIAEAGDHEGSGVAPLPDQPAERLHDLLDMGLGLDAGRAFGQRDAVDLGSARHAQRRHRAVDRRGHRNARVGIDDDDAFAHGQVLARRASRASMDHGRTSCIVRRHDRREAGDLPPEAVNLYTLEAAAP